MLNTSISGTCSVQLKVEPQYKHLKAEITWEENAPLWTVSSPTDGEIARGNSSGECTFFDGITYDQKERVYNLLIRELVQKLEVYKKTEELRVILDEFCKFVKTGGYQVTYRPAGVNICCYLAKYLAGEEKIVTDYTLISLILLEQCNPIGIFRFPIDIVVNDKK